MKIDEIMQALTSVLDLDDQSARSETLTPVMDSIRSYEAEHLTAVETVERLTDEINRLKDENRRLFLMVSEVPEESPAEATSPNYEDLFNDDGSIRKD